MKRATIILFSLLLVSCKIETDRIIISNSNNLEVLIYESGKPTKEYTIKKSGEKYKKLISWCKNNHTGWNRNHATYIPSFLVSGENFSLNFINRTAIINYEGGQFSKDVTPQEYEFLKE